MRLKFYVHCFAHIRSEKLNAGRLGSQATWQLVKYAILPLGFAAFVIAVLVGLPIAYQGFAIAEGWPLFPLPSVEATNYSGLMSMVAQSTAAMLALFFTAVIVVASTAYAKITTEIRILIVEDELNRRYLRLLAHTAATAAAGAGLNAIGVPPSSALAGYVVILSGVCLLAFLPLGIHTIALFDPSKLAGHPSRAFIRAVSIVTNTGRRWFEPSFQIHANRIAENQLLRLSDLMVFGIAENRPRADTVLNIAMATNIIAQIYIIRKLQIPSDSYWFTRKPEFKRWELESSSVTEIALQTGVTPAPDYVPDHRFVETRCAEIIVKCLKYLLAHDAYDDAVKLLLEVNNTATAYAKQFEQQVSIQLIGAIRTPVVEYLKTKDQTLEPLKHLQMADVLCVAAMAPILTTGLSLTEQPIGELVSIDIPLLKLDRRGIYTKPYPRKVLKAAEDLFLRIKFEQATEGIVRTQSWFVKQIIALAWAEVIRDVIQQIVATVRCEFVTPAHELIAAKRALWAGVWLQRAVEACHKARFRIEALEARYAEIKRFQDSKLQWLPSGADGALVEIEAARIQILHLLAGIVPELCAVPTGGTLPDIIGQGRAWFAEELIDMMERKRVGGFKELFRSYFKASLAISRRFIELAQLPGNQYFNNRVAITAILDVMDVSGLAFLFSELDGTQFDKIVAKEWDAYLERAADKPTEIRYLYSAIDSKLAPPWLSPSAMQRQEWGRRLAQAMVNRGIDVDWQYGLPWEREPAKPHTSAVIESVIVSFEHPMIDPCEYFGALYIARREEVRGINLPQRVRDCIKSIERARQRQVKFEENAKNQS